MIRYTCPKCGEDLAVADGREGSVCVCPQCYARTIIPGQPTMPPGAQGAAAGTRTTRAAPGRPAWAEFKAAAQESMVEDRPAAQGNLAAKRPKATTVSGVANEGSDVGWVMKYLNHGLEAIGCGCMILVAVCIIAFGVFMGLAMLGAL